MFGVKDNATFNNMDDAMPHTKKISSHLLIQLKEVVSKKNGKIKSTYYSDPDSRKVSLICSESHDFNPNIYGVISKGTWCNHEDCLGKRIAEGKGVDSKKAEKQGRKVEKIIEIKGGTLLEGKKHQQRRLKIKCSVESHKPFHQNPKRLIDGYWCPQCSRQLEIEKTFSELVEIAKKNGGQIRSSVEDYVNNQSLIECECGECGNIWEASASSIKNQFSWCGICNGGKALTQEEVLKKISEEIKNSGYQLIKVEKKANNGSGNKYWFITYICDAKHIACNRLDHFLKNHRCKECGQIGSMENLSRHILEHLTGLKFPTKRPHWLKTTEGYRLELDGYNKQVEIAFEFQGEQHYKKNNKFHTSPGDFNRQKERDIEKRRLCKSNGVTLIEISYKIEPSKIEIYLRDQLLKAGFSNLNTSHCDLDKVPTKKRKYINEAKKLAQNDGGVLLSERVDRVNDFLWIRFPSGTKRSTLKALRKRKIAKNRPKV